MMFVLQTLVPMGGACTRSPDMVHMPPAALTLVHMLLVAHTTQAHVTFSVVLPVVMGGARIEKTERDVPSSKLVWARAV